jgi:transcriptional regulator with XRE-family HTH domain
VNNKATKLYNLGRNIFKRRKELGYSQNKLAEKLDISREHLAKIETAKRTVSLDLLIDIAETLETKVNKLIDF